MTPVSSRPARWRSQPYSTANRAAPRRAVKPDEPVPEGVDYDMWLGSGLHLRNACDLSIRCRRRASNWIYRSFGAIFQGAF